MSRLSTHNYSITNSPIPTTPRLSHQKSRNSRQIHPSKYLFSKNKNHTAHIASNLKNEYIPFEILREKSLIFSKKNNQKPKFKSLRHTKNQSKCPDNPPKTTLKFMDTKVKAKMMFFNQNTEQSNQKNRNNTTENEYRKKMKFQKKILFEESQSENFSFPDSKQILHHQLMKKFNQSLGSFGVVFSCILLCDFERVSREKFNLNFFQNVEMGQKLGGAEIVDIFKEVFEDQIFRDFRKYLFEKQNILPLEDRKSVV